MINEISWLSVYHYSLADTVINHNARIRYGYGREGR